MTNEINNRDTGNGTFQKIPTGDAISQFRISSPDQIDDGHGDWSFSIFADKNVFLASVGYASQADALRGRLAMSEALKDAIFVATSES